MPGAREDRYLCIRQQMTAYSFENLSAIEFTELVGDLLTAREGSPFSVSPEGPDGGIDILSAGTAANYRVVAQCKRYIKSPFSKLLSKLEPEVERINRLAPDRYIVAVATDLTVTQKGQIRSLFGPALLSVDDVLGRQDINDLLRQFPKIEQAHYKLWLHSTAVLQQLLFEGTGTWQHHTQKDIELHCRIYVQTPAFSAALNVLNHYRTVVIAGSPGIGKTTLAQVLVARHLEEGFTFYEIESLDERPRGIPREGKAILFYDDFLGRSVWHDNATASSESRLDKLFELVERNPDFRLILTTRNYILEAAQPYLETVSHHLPEWKKVVIELEEYSKTVRARILYNHLFFNEVNPGHCISLTNWKDLERILTHHNFVPRVIEWVSNPRDWPPDLTPDNFANYIIRQLDHPSALYRTAINQLIDTSARNVLFALTTAKGDSSPNRLRCIWQRVHGHLGLKSPSSKDFNQALKVVAGSFIKFSRLSPKTGEFLQYLNPGVEETVRDLLWENDDHWLVLCETAERCSELTALASCAPDAQYNPLTKQGPQLPPQWYDRWRALTSLPEGNANDFLEDLGRALNLNVWEGHSSLLLQLVDDIRERGEEEGWLLRWSRLGGRALPQDFREALKQCKWLDDELADEARECVRDNGIAESDDFYSLIERLLPAGRTADSILTEEAEDFITNFLTLATSDEQSEISDSHYSKATWLNQRYHLGKEDEIMNIEGRVKFSPRSPSSTIVAESPSAEDDRIIHGLFASLARISNLNHDD